METLKVFGDYFRIKLSGNSTKRPELSWYLLYVDDDTTIVVIPADYGDDTLKQLLTNVYQYPFAKSIVDNMYYVTVKGYSDQEIIAVLNQF